MIELMGDCALIRPKLTCAAVSAGGIAIPDTAREEDEPCAGEILAVGPGRKCRQTGERTPCHWHVGQSVGFLRFAGAGIEVDGERLLLMRGDEILLDYKHWYHEDGQ